MQKIKNKNDNGYALIGVMAVVMFALILTTAAAPQVKREVQREKEEEMLWRGQQVARAIALYQVAVRGAQLTDLKDLVKGVEVGANKMRFLRPSALCDPMMPCSPGTPNWRTVHPGDPLVKELLDAYLATREKGQVLLPPPPPALVQYAALGSVKLPGQPADTTLDGNIGPGKEDVGEDSKLKKGPIIGVVSQKSDGTFRNYFGITQYDHTLFFPAVPVIVSGFVNPLILAGAIGNPGGPDPRCPRGGVWIDGKCPGSLNPGPLVRP